MIRRAVGAGCVVTAVLACGRRSGGEAERARAEPAPHGAGVQDADVLGREIFAMVDRAVDYRGAHRGRPAASFAQMGIDSLTPTTVRRIVNVDRQPVVTVGFRRAEGHDIVACRGDSSILEDAAVAGRFSLMCTTSSGAERPMQVAATANGGT